MYEIKNTLLFIICRMLIAILFYVLSWIIVASIETGGNSAINFLTVIKAVSAAVFIIIGSMIIGPLLARFCAQSMGVLYIPANSTCKPMPQYSIARAKRRKGLYEEALLEYQKIAGQCPEDSKGYHEMMDIAVENLRDRQKLDEIYAIAKQRIKNKNDLANLTRNYSEGKTRLSSREI